MNPLWRSVWKNFYAEIIERYASSLSPSSSQAPSELRSLAVRPRRRGRKPKASTTFAKKVLAVVAKKEETKYVAQQLQQVVPMGQALITPAGFFNCLTPVTQGVGDFQRIGEKIQPVKACVDFSFNWTNDQSNNQDCIVNLWVVIAKGANSRVALPSVPVGQF